MSRLCSGWDRSDDGDTIGTTLGSKLLNSTLEATGYWLRGARARAAAAAAQ